MGVAPAPIAGRPQTRRVAIAAAFLVGVLALVGVVPALLNRQIRDIGTHLTRDVDPLFATSDAITKAMVDQETGDRGYVITAGPSFLTPYTDGKSALLTLWPQAEAQARLVSPRAEQLLAAERAAAQRRQTETGEPEVGLVQAGRPEQTNERSRLSQRQAVVLVLLALLALAGVALLLYVVRTAQRQPARAEQAALQASEQRYRELVENANDIIYTLRLDGTFADVNGRAEEILGYTRDQLLQLPVGELVPREYQDRMRQMLDQKMDGVPRTTYELEVRAKDGRQVTLEVNSRLVVEAGRPVAAQGIARDITDRKRAEEALRQSEANLRSLASAMPQIVWRARPDATIEFFNDRWYAYTGLTPSESEADAWSRVIHPDDLDSCFASWQRAGAAGAVWEFEYRLRRADGVYRWHLGRSVPIADESGVVTRWAGTATDIDDRRRAEERLAGLQRLTASLSQAVTPADVATAVVGKGLAALDARAVALALVEESGDARIVGAAGYPAEVTAAHTTLPRTAPLPLMDAVRQAAPVWLEDAAAWELAYPATVDEHQSHGLDATAALPLIVEGRVIGGMVLSLGAFRPLSGGDRGFLVAVADQCAQALERARLYEAERDARAAAEAALRVRDEFLGAVSHDLRSPLTTIRGLIQLGARQARRLESPDGVRLAERLGTADGAVSRMGAMIDELLDLTRLETGRPLDLHRWHTDLVALAQRLVQEQQPGAPLHRLRVETGLPVLPGNWDADRIERVLANLLSNAVKYSPAGGEITLTLSAAQADGREWAVVGVQDHGLGIPAGDLPYIFERFHRGSNVAGRIKGMGIGLAGARQIVEQHGGRLSVVSAEGAGATFTMCLPCEPPIAEEIA